MMSTGFCTLAKTQPSRNKILVPFECTVGSIFVNTVIPQNVKLAYKRGLKRVDFMTRSKFGLGHNDHVQMYSKEGQISLPCLCSSSCAGLTRRSFSCTTSGVLLSSCSSSPASSIKGSEPTLLWFLIPLFLFEAKQSPGGRSLALRSPSSVLDGSTVCQVKGRNCHQDRPSDQAHERDHQRHEGDQDVHVGEAVCPPGARGAQGGDQGDPQDCILQVWFPFFGKSEKVYFLQGGKSDILVHSLTLHLILYLSCVQFHGGGKTIINAQC